jgi:adenylate kinase family enzyme
VDNIYPFDRSDFLMTPAPKKIGQRVVVIGTTGSGKTTLAEQLAQIMNVPHIELDALHWEPNWVEASIEVFHSRVEQVIQQPTWVLDGNYSKVRDLVWARADTVIWLDYSLLVIMSRLLKRTIHRTLFKETLWNDNRESLRSAFFSRDSILL